MDERLKQLTAEIVASYVETNKIAADDLPTLIEATFAALNAAGQPAVAEAEPVAKPTRAQIRKSITPDALISFVDGRPYRMLKRHLRTAGLTPADYRERFGLPTDYPATAASYSAKRSALARSAGRGRRTPSEPAASSSPTAETARPEEIAPQAAKAAQPEKAGPGARVPKAPFAEEH